MDMTKAAIKDALGIATDAALAEFFGIERQAVFAWKDDKPIPRGRQWELRAKRPDLFPLDNGQAA